MQLLLLCGQAQHGNTFTDYCNVRSQKKMKRFRSHWKILRTAMAKPPNRRAVASVKILPPGFDLKAWLTWYYPNCPSVIQGWRSAQNTCLHFGKTGARIYPEHFLNEAQLDRKKAGTLRYMPGPPSVFNVPLNIGFVGRAEQTGHPSQKPIKTIEPLILMTTVEDEWLNGL